MANYDTLGLSQRVRDCLEKAGLVSPSSILLLSDSELRKQANLTTEECISIRSHAAKTILNSGFVTVPDACHKLEDKWRRLSVGCKQLDNFLEGGIPVRGITEIAGESGSGKTQLCLQLALSVQYPRLVGGLEGGAVFICTEDAFPSRRLQELINSFPPRFSTSANAVDFSKNIFIEHIGDVDKFKQCVSTEVPYLLKRCHIKLIVVDSIAGVFRADYDPSDAISRAKDLQMVGSQLHKLAHKFNLAVICVNQVADVINGESGQKCVPVLGLAWANMVTTRLQMSRTLHTVPDSDTGLEATVRTLDVTFSPHLPKKSCSFVVARSGVYGID